MSKLITKNKRAFFEYQIIEQYTAGIKLKGSEVKSIRANNFNMTESYCIVSDNEVFIKNLHISEHKQGGIYNNHEPLRDRKLLLKKKEIANLHEKVKQKGLTIVPLSIILSDTGFIKVEIGLCKGKKLHDKRTSIKEKDIKRELERNL